jgi:hypothetical protein
LPNWRLIRWRARRCSAKGGLTQQSRPWPCVHAPLLCGARALRSPEALPMHHLIDFARLTVQIRGHDSRTLQNPCSYRLQASQLRPTSGFRREGRCCMSDERASDGSTTTTPHLSRQYRRIGSKPLAAHTFREPGDLRRDSQSQARPPSDRH